MNEQHQCLIGYNTQIIKLIILMTIFNMLSTHFMNYDEINKFHWIGINYFQ
jgi:hypothetical protein